MGNALHYRRRSRGYLEVSRELPLRVATSLEKDNAMVFAQRTSTRHVVTATRTYIDDTYMELLQFSIYHLSLDLYRVHRWESNGCMETIANDVLALYR